MNTIKRTEKYDNGCIIVNLPEYKWLATEADRHGPLHKADDAHTAAYKRRHAANLALTRALSAAGQR